MKYFNSEVVLKISQQLLKIDETIPLHFQHSWFMSFCFTFKAFDPLVIKKKIRVNVICPPFVDTPLVNGGLVPESRYQEGFNDMLQSMKPYIQ